MPQGVRIDGWQAVQLHNLSFFTSQATDATQDDPMREILHPSPCGGQSLSGSRIQTTGQGPRPAGGPRLILAWQARATCDGVSHHDLEPLNSR